jgi:uncharacterized protein (TIGR01777 family)
MMQRAVGTGSAAPGWRLIVGHIVVAGGTGLIGRALVAALNRRGDTVTILTRSPAASSSAARRALPAGARLVTWNPDEPGSATEALRGAIAVVNVTGVPIGPLPWTAGRRLAITGSRVGSTRTLVEAIRRLPEAERPRVLVNASGTDCYTGLDDVPATEDAPTAASGFLVGLGEAWEGAAREAEPLGLRVVLVRTAFVLSRGNAMLRLLALPTRLGAGGPIGGGRQWFSWIHIDDLVTAYLAAIDDARLAGVVNASAPEPCHQREVAEALGRILRRPAFVPVPGWAVRLVMREEATLILGSRRVAPARLLEAGMAFRFPDLESALRDALGVPAKK